MPNLEFISRSTTFLVQPLDMGDLCCTKLVNYILEEIKKWTDIIISS
jgi:hypothetical protein